MRSIPITRVAMLLAVSIATACASANTSAGGNPSPDRYTISEDELASAQYGTIYDLVRSRHPDWLINRATQEFSPTVNIGGGKGTSPVTTGATATTGSVDVQVFVNGTHAGGLDMLKQYSPPQVTLVRYYNASQAESKFGTGYLNGVIELTTK